MNYHHNNEITLDRLINGYIEFIKDRIENGFTFYFITVIFRPLPGTFSIIQKLMMTEVERVYSLLLTRTVRNPNRVALKDLPLWIACLDFPVPKHARKPLATLAVNDGQHVHALALVPPFTRLKRPLDVLIRDNQALLTKNQERVFRVHAKRVSETPGKVVDYALKSLARGRVGPDSILILPKTRAEVSASGPVVPFHPAGKQLGIGRRAR